MQLRLLFLLSGLGLASVTAPLVIAQPSEERMALIEAAEQGDISAQRAVGTGYFRGSDGFPVDEPLATVWLTKAAESGDPYSQVMLAGFCVKRGDFPLAFDWCEKAAKAGYPPGLTGLGLLYLKGDGAPRYPAGARRLFLAAASLLDASAMVELGKMELNREVEKAPRSSPLREAKPLLVSSSAAEEDDTPLPESIAMAREWFKMAAVLGDPYAQRLVAYGGQGEPAVNRLIWASIAADSGDRVASILARVLTKDMSPDLVNEAHVCAQNITDLMKMLRGATAYRHLLDETDRAKILSDLRFIARNT
jgi:TPR repeat protein